MPDVLQARIATHAAAPRGTGSGELVPNNRERDLGIVSRLVPIGLSDWLRYGGALPRPWGGRTVEGREQLGMGANPRKIHLQQSFDLEQDRLRSPSAAARNAPQGLFAIAARPPLRCGTLRRAPTAPYACQNMRRMPHDGAGSTDL